MDFDFSEEERLIQEQTGRFLRDRCDMAAVRRVLDGEQAYARDVWQGVAELGLAGTAIAEAYGGVDAGYLSLCLVAQEMGAHVAPIPFSSSVYLAAEALSLFGSEAQKSRWLPQIASGEVIAAVAVNETLSQPTEGNIACAATAGGLSGSKLAVADGGIADLAVVLARGNDGLDMHLVELAGEGVRRRVVDTVDPTRNTATLTFDGAGSELLGDAGQGWAQLQRLYDRAAVLFAFEQVGGAQAALDMAVAYAQERFAFGRPIGSFQALKHMMADMYVALKLAESNCYYAAWALASDAPELPLAAATARVSATQAYQLCSRDNIQVHGGMGFTWEFDCHLYYRRSNYLALQLGGLSVWENKLVDALARAA